jgi:predicted cupin superfamily sugar epimerase
MDPRAAELINLLKLEPHPEGGYYREVYRSADRVQLLDGRKERRALTTIYFLLTEGDYSAWHRVKSDEVWHFYEGASLELYSLESGSKEYEQYWLHYPDKVSNPVAVVPARYWQAARTMGNYTLVGCTVGPGFDFEDFQMLRDVPEEESEIRQQFPELTQFI